MNKFFDWVLGNSTLIFLWGCLFYYAYHQNKEYTFAFTVIILLYVILGAVNRIEKLLTDKLK